jgi:hypothetical protein
MKQKTKKYRVNICILGGRKISNEEKIETKE